MTRVLLVVLGILLLGFLVIGGWWWLSREESPPMRLVIRGSSGTSGQFGISGGNLHVVAPRPGIFFGTVRAPGDEEQFTYVVLFRYGFPRSDDSSRRIATRNTTELPHAETSDLIEIDGKRIEAVYHVELDEKVTGIASQSLTLGGKPMDLGAGRVFLIDLSADAPEYRQKDLKLPAVSKLEKPEDVERIAEELRKTLAGQDPEIEAFLK